MKMPAKISFNDLISKVNEKNRYYILGGFLFILFLLDYFIIMKGQLTALNNLNPKIMILKQDISTAKDNISKVDFLEKEFNRLKSKYETSSVKVLSQEEIPLILEGISQFAEQNKVKIEQIIPVKGSQEQVLANSEGKYYAFPIMIEARGGFHAIGRFIDQMEKDKVFKSITSIKLAGIPEDPSRHSLKMTIKTIIVEKPE